VGIWDARSAGPKENAVTIKAYLNDTSLQTTALVTSVALDAASGRAIVRLDRTLFHPQGGGQKSDRGTLGGVAVTHVTHAVEGQVDHFLATSEHVLRVGTEVSLEVDAAWRAVNASSHTAGHLLAALVERRYPGVRAEAGHHWPGEARVEFVGPVDKLLEDLRQHLEHDAHDAIANDLVVTVEGDPFHSRTVRIGTFPAVPCGGTHVTSTAALATLVMTGVRVKSGRLRVSYRT
jgi:Ser-tRNA(Ala) deacylase AlaX